MMYPSLYDSVRFLKAQGLKKMYSEINKPMLYNSFKSVNFAYTNTN